MLIKHYQQFSHHKCLVSKKTTMLQLFKLFLSPQLVHIPLILTQNCISSYKSVNTFAACMTYDITNKVFSIFLLDVMMPCSNAEKQNRRKQKFLTGIPLPDFLRETAPAAKNPLAGKGLIWRKANPVQRNPSWKGHPRCKFSASTLRPQPVPEETSWPENVGKVKAYPFTDFAW